MSGRRVDRWRARLSLKASINASPVAARAQRTATNIGGLARTTPPCRTRILCPEYRQSTRRQDGLQSSSTAGVGGEFGRAYTRPSLGRLNRPSTGLWIALTSKPAARPAAEKEDPA